LSTMLRAVLKDNLRLWEECLPHIEFAYNRSIHCTTNLSPFMVVYGFNPRAPIDLLPLPPSEIVNLDATQRSEFILKLHETTKLQIEKMNENYRIAVSKGRKEVKLEPGDLVWVHLRKDRFPDLRKSKLMPRAAGPFKVLAQDLTGCCVTVFWAVGPCTVLKPIKVASRGLARPQLLFIQ
jgi:hypothetical protein